MSNAVRWVLASYVRLALVTYLVVVTTGVISALVLVPLPQLVSTAYGKVLLIKIGLVGAASAVALGARAMAIEAAVLVVVLGASAVLVSTPPPTGAASAAAPPQPTGSVLPLGALAGQVGISVTASDGLLVVRLSTPRRGDYYAAEPDQDYSLTASLGASALALTGCGTGCYFARPVWRNGDNVLTLRAGATGWTGAPTGLIVSWPPHPGAADLASAVAATRATGRLAVYETVTSDTTAGSPEPNRLDLDAGFFLSQQPYSDGTAPIAARTSPPGAVARLALGYPAASLSVQLTLDDRGRITEEILTDPKHLVTRRIVYPSPE